MITQRQSIIALCALAAVAAAPSVSAQEPGGTEPPGQGVPTQVLIVPVASVPSAPIRTVEADTAERDSTLDHHMAAPNRGFEMVIGAGAGFPIGEGFGEFNNVTGADLRDVADGGGAVALTLGYRANRSWMIGAYGEGARYGARALADVVSANIWAAGAGIVAEYHFRPTFGIDPFLNLGTGWKGFWVDPNVGQSVSVMGWEMARMNFGVDFRLTRGFALAPVIGGDATLFMSKSGPTTDGFETISEVNFFLFGGIQGRFDFGRPKPTPNYAKGQSNSF